MTSLRKFVTLALALTACTVSFEAGAAYSCTISVTPISTVYSPTVAANNDSTGSYTINCTRAAGDANTMDYNVRANNGNQPAGNTNRVQFGATVNRYNYELYQNAGFTQEWRDTAGTRINGTLTFGASLTASVTGPFYLRVPGPQPVDPAGTYLDTVTVSLRRTAAGPDPVLFNSSFGVSVITTNSCQISVPPGNVIFTYTSFQAAPAAASTAYGVRCTTAFPYTMTLDGTVPYTYSLLGLTYTLSLPASATGTGLTQTHTINGNIAAGQAGTCATGVCNASQTRTLTISW